LLTNRVCVFAIKKDGGGQGGDELEPWRGGLPSVIKDSIAIASDEVPAKHLWEGNAFVKKGVTAPRRNGGR